MYLFDGGVDISCLNAADSNGDGNLDVSDCSFLMIWYPSCCPLPPAPGAWPSPCGTSTPLEPPVGFLLGCEAYEGC